MKQHYFVVVLAHSLHGRLRRIHIPHHSIYVVLALALFGGFSLFGMVSSYLRMTWKVANYNSLRTEFDTLRNKYQEQQREIDQKQEQLASLQLMATEVSMALGLRRKIEGTDDISEEGPLMPNFSESIEQYNFLKSANFSRLNRTYARAWQKNIVPSMWPVNGRLLSRLATARIRSRARARSILAWISRPRWARRCMPPRTGSSIRPSTRAADTAGW